MFMLCARSIIADTIVVPSLLIENIVNERLVDLQRVLIGNCCNALRRRIAGTEIVDRKAQTQIVELRENPNRDFRGRASTWSR